VRAVDGEFDGLGRKLMKERGQVARRKNFQAEHHELQRILARELAEYGPQPLNAQDADTVAWHLADVTLAVVMRAVEEAEISSPPS
jgi:hypothetical protein